MIGQNELVFGTNIKGKLEGDFAEVSFETNLTGDGNTNTVVHAIAHLHTGTGKPAQPIGDATSPLIDTCQIEEVGLGFQSHTQVEFKTVSTQTFLIGNLCAIAGTTTEAETDSILCISCNTKGEDCHEKYKNFLHNVIDFKFVNK